MSLANSSDRVDDHHVESAPPVRCGSEGGSHGEVAFEPGTAMGLSARQYQDAPRRDEGRAGFGLWNSVKPGSIAHLLLGKKAQEAVILDEASPHMPRAEKSAVAAALVGPGWFALKTAGDSDRRCRSARSGRRNSGLALRRRRTKSWAWRLTNKAVLPANSILARKCDPQALIGSQPAAANP